MKVVIASVVYKDALDYLDDFLNSLREQITNQKYTILLLNDDIPDELLQNLVKKICWKKNQEILIVNSCKKKSISQLRVQMIREAKMRGYDFMILSDCDDKLSPNRIDCYLKAFDLKYSFYYNDLLRFDGQNVMPELPPETLSWTQIEEENYLGLSNTGIYLENFSLDFIDSLDRGETKIFDWYLFCRILLIGMKGKKVEDCYTYYRIHDRNIAGENTLCRERIEKEITVKIEHYSLLEDENPIFGYLRSIYEAYNTEKDNLVLNSKGIFWWGLIKRNRQEKEGGTF